MHYFFCPSPFLFGGPGSGQAHPHNYQNFMAVLCNYIVERQRNIQGDEILLPTMYVSLAFSLSPSSILLFIPHYCAVICNHLSYCTSLLYPLITQDLLELSSRQTATPSEMGVVMKLFFTSPQLINSWSLKACPH